MLAGLAVAEAAALTGGLCAILPAATRRGAQRAMPFSPKRKMADEPIDLWLKPYERTGDARGGDEEYLDWETDLLPRIERDGIVALLMYRRAGRLSSGRSFQQHFGKTLGRFDHHIVAARHLIGAPRRIGLIRLGRQSRIGIISSREYRSFCAIFRGRR